MQQLLFAPCYRKLSKEKAAKLKSRSPKQENENDEISISEDDTSEEEIKSGNKDDSLVEVLAPERTFRVENIFV